ncbi:MAG: hypothetical protein JSS93_14960 [Bacteroidetes bacterium]|nr:hypothetical protein [Bacteroidota bacterium]
MSIFSLLFRKFYYAIWKRIYTNETVGVYEMAQRLSIQSDGLSIQPVSLLNLNDARSFQNPFQLNQFKKLLQKGDIGYYGYWEETCVHRSWVTIGPEKINLHPMVSRKLKTGEVFIHFCETAATLRGKNIFTAVLSYIGQQWTDKKILISADHQNSSSIKSIKKSGFTEIERIHIIIFFGLRFIKHLSVHP